MPARALPNLGLEGFFDLGEDGWKDEMDLNILKLSVLVQGQADSKSAALPGSPAGGEVVILDETHGTNPNDIAVYDDGAWVYITPNEGWLMFSLADSLFYKFDSAEWVVFGAAGYTDAQARAAVSIAPATIADAAYTLVLGDAYGYHRLTNVAGCDITVPPNSDVAFAIGTVITFRQAVAAASTLVAGTGVTLNAPGGAGGSLEFAEEGATVQIKKISTDAWDVIGGTST